ncbi:MAG: four helix bundle protein [Patescibacteria group bacterium]
MASYKELIVWQKSFLLTKMVFKVTANFPKSEIYGLSSQMRRCSVSIPSNIAEGNARGHKKEYLQFLRTSFASGAELETQLLLSKELGFINESDYNEINNLLVEVLKMLNKLISVIK